MSTNEFDKEFYNTVLTVKEKDFNPDNVAFRPEDAYHIEKAVIDLLEVLGFRICDKGFRYLAYIISENVKCSDKEMSMTYWYKRCANKFSVTSTSVEAGISNAIKTASKSSKLRKLNSIFGCEYVICDGISNSMLIAAISTRFALQFRYIGSISF